MEFIDDGTAWRPIIDGVPGTQPPALASWTVLGTGSTFADQTGTLVGTVTAGTARVSGIFVAKAATVTATAFFRLSVKMKDADADNPISGFFVQDSAGSKLSTIGVSWENTGAGFAPHWQIDDWTNLTTYSAFVAGFSSAISSGFWGRFKDDNTNHTLEISGNGVDWVLLWSRARASFVPSGGNRIGVGFYSGDTAQAQIMNLVSWKAV